MISMHVRDIGETNTRENVIGLITVEMTNLTSGAFGTFEKKDVLITEKRRERKSNEFIRIGSYFT